MVLYTLEQRWEILQHYFCRFWQKKIIFSDEAHFDLGGYLNKQNCRLWGTENPHAYIKNPTHPKRVSVWFGFWSRVIIGRFFFFWKWARTGRYSQWRSLLGHVEQIFVHNWILATFGLNRTALCATQLKLHLMFCALFLKIALSAAELMSFSHLGAGIWHCCTIIYGVPSKLKCYADKPETTDTLKDSICEIQMHTIAAAEKAIWMKLLSIINRNDCTFK